MDDKTSPVQSRWTQALTQVLISVPATVVAVVALYFTMQQTSEELRATRDQVGLSEQGQLTDRFSKAVEQLGTQDSLEVRLGGIYALERIALDSARDHPTVMEVLSACVREHAPRTTCTSLALSARPTTDVQAILTVIARRDENRDRDTLDLNNTCLPGASFGSTSLVGADLSRTDLSGANLIGANLNGANLGAANLGAADLGAADLGAADLGAADLRGAFFDVANLSYANLTGANLTGAHLERANLSGANLTNANLTHAHLIYANLTGANLTGADRTCRAGPGHACR